MSDRDDIKPDPIDKAYVEAEAVLNDDAARAARRAALLAALTQPDQAPQEKPAPVITPAPVRYRPTWRREGWLAAAAVAGLSLFLALRVYAPTLHPHPATSPPPANAAAAPAAATAEAPLTAPAGAPVTVPQKASPPPPPAAASGPSGTVTLRAPAPPAVAAPVTIPAPRADRRITPMTAPPPPVDQAPKAAQAAQADAGTTVGEVVVTGSRIPHPQYTSASPITALGGADADQKHQGLADGKRRAQAKVAPPPPPPPPPEPEMRFTASAAAPADQTEGLADAAGGGRTSEVEALLAHGTPVDAPDAQGNTPLMRSIRANHPAVAALLRRHGASLDRKNHAGESARDLAKAKGDPKLDKALGLARKP